MSVSFDAALTFAAERAYDTQKHDSEPIFKEYFLQLEKLRLFFNNPQVMKIEEWDEVHRWLDQKGWSRRAKI